MSKCDFIKVAKQFYWNHASVWVFSCKFAAYFQDTFFMRTPMEGCFWTEPQLKHIEINEINLTRETVD